MGLTDKEKEELKNEITSSISQTVAESIASEVTKAMSSLNLLPNNDSNKPKKSDENNGDVENQEESESLEEKMFLLQCGSEKKYFDRHPYMFAHREHNIHTIDKNHINYADQDVIRCILRWICLGNVTEHKKAVGYAASKVPTDWLCNQKKKQDPSLLLKLVGAIDFQYQENPHKKFEKSEIRDLYADYKDSTEKPSKYSTSYSKASSSSNSGRSRFRSCFNYNRTTGCNDKKCNYAHICFHCAGHGKKAYHAMFECEDHNSSNCNCHSNMA